MAKQFKLHVPDDVGVLLDEYLSVEPYTEYIIQELYKAHTELNQLKVLATHVSREAKKGSPAYRLSHRSADVLLSKYAVVTVNALISWFRLPEFEEAFDLDAIRDQAWQVVRDDNAFNLNDEDESDAFDQAVDDLAASEENDHFRDYMGAIEYVFETAFDDVHLNIESTDRIFYQIKLQMGHTWSTVASGLIRIINGVGTFHFANTGELKKVGPYKSIRDAVLDHIPHVSDYFAIYGSTARRVFEGRLR